jgi:hypothetical protein
MIEKNDFSQELSTICSEINVRYRFSFENKVFL